MITQPVTSETLAEWKALWMQYKDRLRPNRKTGTQVLEYLRRNYSLTEITDPAALAVVTGNVTDNEYLREKLPVGASPIPRAFYLNNAGQGRKFYCTARQSGEEADAPARLFVGVDLASGFFHVESSDPKRSALLWDELCAFRGVDEKDLQNYIIVAQYLLALERFGKLEAFAESNAPAAPAP